MESLLSLVYHVTGGRPGVLVQQTSCLRAWRGLAGRGRAWQGGAGHGVACPHACMMWHGTAWRLTWLAVRVPWCSIHGSSVSTTPGPFNASQRLHMQQNMPSFSHHWYMRILLSHTHTPAGLRLKASFAEAGQSQERSLFGKLACIGRPQVVG